MKYVLEPGFRWVVASKDGSIKVPHWDGKEDDRISGPFKTRESAISALVKIVNESNETGNLALTTNSLILVEEHTVGINWDE